MTLTVLDGPAVAPALQDDGNPMTKAGCADAAPGAS